MPPPFVSTTDLFAMNSQPSLIERIACVASSSIALRHRNLTLTYGELNQAAARIALHLQALGVPRGACVALCMERSFAHICAALGILHAGAAYVPIDPEWPEQRIRHVLANSGCAALLAPSILAASLKPAVPTFDPTGMLQAEATPKTPHPIVPPAPSDLAYIIYTSGSTGVPKGVEITHGNLAHLLAWHRQAFQITPLDRATHLAGLGFDAAVWEIWPYLAVGASISLAGSLTRNDPALLQQWLVDEEITVSFIPTPLAEPLVAMLWPAKTRLRLLLTGGDTLHTAPGHGLPFQLINNYGPSECTVVATSCLVSCGVKGLPSIGTAIAGAAVYLLDESRNPVIDGEPGEIYVGGAGVGRGYRNLPEQTAQSFLHDPFSADPDARMYKTGDMALRCPDGQISFQGRRDTQQKIRGYRIELDEIVHVLNRHPAIAFSTVVVRTSPAGERILVAYLVPVEAQPIRPRELQEFANRALPDYMVPSTFVRLDAIPLSFNGKVDLRSLPEPGPHNTLAEASSRQPATEVEQLLLDSVRALLHTDLVGVEDDFFLAGGHSLLGTQVVLRARETFGVLLTLRDLFEAPTVALLATRIEELLIEQLESMSEEQAEEEAFALVQQSRSGEPRP